MRTPSHKQIRGFPLIDLLVVIAIIGILSSVVLASLYLARQKGNDAAIKSDLHTIQTQIEIVRSNSTGESYGAATRSCGTIMGTTFPSSGADVYITDSVINKAAKDAFAKGGGIIMCAYSSGGALVAPTNYAIEVPLPSSPGKFWCLDDSGRAKVESTVAGMGGTGSTAASCP